MYAIRSYYVERCGDEARDHLRARADIWRDDRDDRALALRILSDVELIERAQADQQDA